MAGSVSFPKSPKQSVAGRASGREGQLTGAVANSRSRPEADDRERPLFANTDLDPSSGDHRGR